MTLAPRRIGDRRQRYVLHVLGWPEETRWVSGAYSMSLETLTMAAQSMALAPGWVAARIEDRDHFVAPNSFVWAVSANAPTPDPWTRNSGNTTQQMLLAPARSVYVWPTNDLSYPHALAAYLRLDLEIVAPSWLRHGGGWRRRPPGFALAFDHGFYHHHHEDDIVENARAAAQRAAS